jgi:DNA-binding transcriptional LysR family regulator
METMTEPLPIALLEILIAVGETRSFTDAALRLSVTKATVSRGIAKLEEFVGETLVLRNSHRVQLTPLGNSLYDRAAPSIKNLRGLRDSLQVKTENDVAGIVRIACPPEIAAEVLSPIIERFTRVFPGIRLELSIADLGNITSTIPEGADLLIRAASPAVPEPGGTKLLFSRLCAYAKAGYELDHGKPDGLRDRRHRWVIKPVAGLEWPITNVAVNDYITALRVLQRGGTIGFLPGFMGDHAVARGELMRIDIPGFDPPGGYLMLFGAPEPRPAPVQMFVDFLLEATIGLRTA